MGIDHKFLPEGIPGWQQPFWDSLAEHGVKVQKCDDCGTYRYAPKEICNRCYSAGYSWSPVSGRGTVYTYTVVHRAPTPAYQDDAPYTLVHVEMEEGFRMVGILTGPEPQSVAVGQPVRATYRQLSPDWTILEFEPAQKDV